MKQAKQFYSETIDNFSFNSLCKRTKVSIPHNNTVIVPSKGKEICRIIYSMGRAFVSVQEKHIQTIREYLRTNDISLKICSPLLYQEILELLGYDFHNFLLEPSEEFLQDIKYNCVHTLDYVCDKNSFLCQNANKIEKICRGDERFILNEDFDSTMYCITDNSKIASCSYYKTNSGIFTNTASMQVFTRPEHRGKGYGKSVASAATQSVIDNEKLALWVCQVENTPSRKIAESLGYMLLGGEVRIVT